MESGAAPQLICSLMRSRSGNLRDSVGEPIRWPTTHVTVSYVSKCCHRVTVAGSR
jgi:hypothetical protein